MKKYKRIVTVFFAVFMLINLSTVAFAIDYEDTSLSEIYRDHTSYTMVVSRKGYWKYAPENSVKAIKAAENAGADIIEIDIKMTSDNVLILMEDDTVTRTCYGYGEKTEVASMTTEEIQALNLLMGEGGVNATKTQETVPTLEEVFAQRSIDVSSSSSSSYKSYALLMVDADWELRDAIYTLAEKYSMLNSIIFYIDDATADEISEWKASLPSEPMTMTYFKGNVIFVATSKVKNASEASDGIHLATKNPYGVVFGETVQNKAYESGIRTMASPCMPEICGKIMQDTEEWWDYLISCGFNVIMTDYVAELREYVDSSHNKALELDWARSSLITGWELPDFKSDNYHDYKLAYTNAAEKVETLLNKDLSRAYSDISEAVYELQKAYDDINANYNELEDGTAGMTVTPLRILLSALAIAAVTCAEIFVYRKKKKS